MTVPPSRWASDGRDWPHRDVSRFVEAGGVRWHVQIAGMGPVVLLLHGTGASTHSWRDLLPLLTPHFTVVAPDLPGHGFSTPIARPTLAAMARAVAALTVALDLPPTLIAGHSAGAAIALRLGLDVAPVPVIGFGAALLPFPGIAAKLFPAMARLLFVNPLVPAIFAAQARDRATVARFLARSTGSSIEPFGIELYARLFARRAHVASALGMMANWDLDSLKSDLPRFGAELLLIHGEQDVAVPPSVSRDVAGLVPSAEARIIPTLGHLAHEERPVLAAEAIVAAAGRWGIIEGAREHG